MNEKVMPEKVMPETVMPETEEQPSAGLLRL